MKKRNIVIRGIISTWHRYSHPSHCIRRCRSMVKARSGYEARFYICGICALMKEYGFYDLVPAMCHLDYTMSELGGASDFVREYTLASGGPYCDCGYKKKGLV